MQKAGAGFVKWLNVERLKREPMVFNLKASKDERADLAQRLGIVEIVSLEISGNIERKKDSKLLELSAVIKAEVIQACVVSLEPVAQKIEEKFAVCYTFDKKDAFLKESDYVVSSEENDLPEMIEEGQIDVVNAAVEQIALALDPYPRAEEAENSDSAEILRQSEKKVEAEALEVHKPFANLKELLNKK